MPPFYSIHLSLLAVIVCTGMARAGETVPEGYRTVARELGVPHTLLYAVALTESGRRLDNVGIRPWPWALNVSGQGYYFSSRTEAWQALRQLLKSGSTSIDIGLMQVNWRYHRSRLGTPWQALDPYHNLRVGAGILRGCFQQKGDWWTGVGCYHAPNNSERAARYRRRVQSRWQRLIRAWKSCWSMPDMSRMSQGARATCWIASGCSSFIPMGY